MQTEGKFTTWYPSIDKPWLKYYSQEAITAQMSQGSIYVNVGLNLPNTVRRKSPKLVKRNQPIKKVIAFLYVSFTLMYANATVKSKHGE